MRPLPLPTTDDLGVLNNLARSRAASAKNIREQHPQIRAQYLAYEAAKGDPWQLVGDPTLAGFRGDFNNLYERPPVAIAHLKAQRGGLTGACPMCGRDALGTLDHYLPQANYPEFSFYSKNLVPACSRCNTARSNSVKGSQAGQRALQPYFDRFSAQRVMTVELSPDWRAPDIRPIPFNVEGPELDVVQWQIDNVIIPSGFIEYAAPLWGTFVDNPLSLFDVIPTEVAICNKLDELIRGEVAMSQSKNGWRSCFFHGVRNSPGAVAFLAQRVQEVMNQPPV